MEKYKKKTDKKINRKKKQSAFIYCRLRGYSMDAIPSYK